MALGISERLLEKAYGPQDFSYAYRKIDEVQRRQSAEQRAREQEAQKLYYSNLSDINKQRIGAREIDIPEIMENTNKWSSIEKQLSSNPNLIRQDPEKYYKLKQEADNNFTKALTLIRGSRDMAKFERETLNKMSDPRNMDYYAEGAPNIWKQSVMNQPLSRIREMGSDDITKYYETQIDGKDFFNSLPTKISGTLQNLKIVDPTFKGATGEIRMVEYDKMPNIGSIYEQVDVSLDGNLGKKANKFALQQFESAVKSKDYEKTIARFEDFFDDKNNEGAKAYGLPAKKPFEFNPEGNSRQEFVKYLSAKEFLSRLPRPEEGKAMFGSESARMRYGASLRKGPAAPKEAPEIKGLDEEFAVIAKGGEAGAAMAKETSRMFNSIGSSKKLFPFTIITEFQSQPGYSTGAERARVDLGTDASIKDPKNVKKDREKLKKAADKLNEINKQNGFFNSDITENALATGKVMVLTDQLVGGGFVNQYLNTAGANSLEYINSFIKPSQMTAGGKRAGIGERVSVAESPVKLSQPQQKSIKQSEVAAKAKASGYTPSEYEALLRKNNVKIIK